MKNILYLLSLSLLLFSCQKKENTKTYIARVIKNNENFNKYSEGTDTLSITKFDNKNSATTDADTNEYFGVKFGDTVIRIQTDPNDTSSANGKFSQATFVNTQKTCLLIQLADQSGLTAPFYLIALKDGNLDVVQLYRPSKGVQNDKLMGLVRVGRDGYVINHDFFITNVNSKLYFIKRQDPEERIKGSFFLLSPDKQTLAFLMPSSVLYQVHYSSGEVFNQPLSVQPEDPDIYNYVQNNYIWEKNKKSVQFLKRRNDDRIVDIKEFK